MPVSPLTTDKFYPNVSALQVHFLTIQLFQLFSYCALYKKHLCTSPFLTFWEQIPVKQWEDC